MLQHFNYLRYYYLQRKARIINVRAIHLILETKERQLRSSPTHWLSPPLSCASNLWGGTAGGGEVCCVEHNIRTAGLGYNEGLT